MVINRSYNIKRRKGIYMVKKDIVCKASKMKRKAMFELYEKYKKQIYSFCLLLSDDEAIAQKSTLNALNFAWNRIKILNISEDEEFFKFAVTDCAKAILKDKKRNIKSISPEEMLSINIEREKYTGDIEKGIGLYKTAIGKLDEESADLIILYFAGRLELKEISDILRVRLRIIKWAFKNSAATFSRLLNKVSIGGTRCDAPTINQLRSFYREYAKFTPYPEELDKDCILNIKKKSKFRLW